LQEHKEKDLNWKSSFRNALKDSKRTYISAFELCQFHWVFSDMFQYPVFFPTGQLVMPLYPLLSWEFNDDGSVQVEQFPLHVVTRTQNWGWVIKNHAVSFFSLERDVEAIGLTDKKIVAWQRARDLTEAARMLLSRYVVHPRHVRPEIQLLQERGELDEQEQQSRRRTAAGAEPTVATDAAAHTSVTGPVAADVFVDDDTPLADDDTPDVADGEDGYLNFLHSLQQHHEQHHHHHHHHMSQQAGPLQVQAGSATDRTPQILHGEEADEVMGSALPSSAAIVPVVDSASLSSTVSGTASSASSSSVSSSSHASSSSSSSAPSMPQRRRRDDDHEAEPHEHHHRLHYPQNPNAVNDSSPQGVSLMLQNYLSALMVMLDRSR